jgi:TatD DNase family protein
MKYFDAHCHLQFPQFDSDRGTIISHMRKDGTGAIVVGTDLATSRAGVELAEQHNFLWASVGLHPNDNIDEHFDMSKYEELAKHPKVVGIGECGLDYFRSGGTEKERVVQKERFENQIELAKKVNKALIVHCRNAHDDCSSILQKARMTVPVVMHFFTASGDIAKKYLDLGCHLSFPGPITYTEMYDESIRVAPLEKILIETDAPFAAPVPYRGKRNEPAYVVEVIKKIAQVKEVDEEEVRMQIVENAQKVFRI